MHANPHVVVAHGEALSRYRFPDGHPFGGDRLGAFWYAMSEEGLADRVEVTPPVTAGRDEVARFHTDAYLDLVETLSERGSGFLDSGDTPVFPGAFEAAATVVGTTLDVVARVVSGRCLRAFAPVGGLHHARRDAGGGFCIFNDCGVAIETLRSVHGMRRIAYVDIDAHHGDGVYAGFADDPDMVIADIHEDGRHLFPGTGFAHERGTGPGRGRTLNVPLPPGAGDDEFLAAFERVEAHVDRARPELILLQCGADGLEGDPLTHLRYSSAVHEHATRRLCRLAARHCGGRLVAMGGGGYDRRNLARAWTAVVRAMLELEQAARTDAS